MRTCHMAFRTIATDGLNELHAGVLMAKHVNLCSSFEPLCCRPEDYWFGCKNFCQPLASCHCNILTHQQQQHSTTLRNQQKALQGITYSFHSGRCFTVDNNWRFERLLNRLECAQKWLTWHRNKLRFGIRSGVNPQC